MSRPATYTMIPNDILDSMSNLNPAAFKLAMALCRFTYGYHRDSVTMSLPEIQNATGLSKQGVLNAAAQISQFFTKERQGNSIIWQVNGVDYKKSNQLTDEAQEVKSVDQTSQLSVPSTSGLKEKEIKEDSGTNVPVANGVATGQPALFVLPEPSQGKPNGKGKGRKKPPADPEATAKTKELLDRYGEVLGCKIANYGQEGAAAVKILKTYTAEDAIGCYRWLKAKPYWSDKHLSLATVHTQLGEWVKLGRPGMNGENGRDLLWTTEFLPYLNGTKQFTELCSLVQQGIREQGESNVKRQPAGVTKRQFDAFLAARH